MNIIIQDTNGLFSCIFMLIVLGFAWRSVTFKTKTKYIKPKIIRVDKNGEFEVMSSHISHITRVFMLPANTWIKRISKGTYRVSVPMSNGYKVRERLAIVHKTVVDRKSVIARVLRLIGVD